MFDDDQTEDLELDDTEAEEEAAEEDVSEPDLDDTEAEDDVEEEESDEEEGQDPEAQEDDSDAFSVSFDGDDDAKPEPEAAPEWARELRKRQRETAKENRDLKAKLAALEGAKETAKLGDKPTLATCDYDEDRFEAELASWHEQKREFEKQKQAEAEAKKAEADAWQKRLDEYHEEKAELSTKVSDFDEAEEIFAEIFSPAQQGATLHVADKPSILIYALSKNPKKAQELAEIKDQALFIKALTRLEANLKVKNVKTAPKPEKRPGGGGMGAPKSSEKKLKQLREHAQKTGDFSKVIAYRKQMQAKAK